MVNPWERETGLEMPSGVSLLDPDFPLRLSEFDIRPESQWQYFFGSLLAGLHGSEQRYTDFHPGNVGLDPRTGQFVILDPGGVVDTKLNPREMVSDFLIPYQTLSPEDFNAFLAGYIRHAYALLDIKYEGYTRAILNEVGGQLISTPDPGRAAIDLSNLLWQLHLVLGDDLSLSLDRELDPSRLDYSRLDDYHLVLFQLYIYGAPIGILDEIRGFLQTHLPLPSDHPGIRPTWWALTQFFDYVQLEAGAVEGSRPGDPVSDNIVSWLTNRSFAALEEFRKHVIPNSAEWRPNWALIPILKMRPEGFAPLDYVRLVDKVLSITGHFARIMDEYWLRNANSIACTRSRSFMQFSIELLASTIGHPRWDEIRYVRLLNVFNRLSWRADGDLDHITASNRTELYNYIRLSHSLLRLELTIFGNSVDQVRNQGNGHPFWSLAWHALCRAREMLYATETLLEEGQGLMFISEEVRYHFGLILSDYGEVLSAIARSSASAIGPSPFAACLVHKDGDEVQKGTFMRELEWVKSLFDLVQTTPAPFPQFIETMHAGREFFVSNPRIVRQRK